MLTRRELMVRAGVFAGAGTSLWSAGDAFATAPPAGYQIGQRPPAFSGLDQFMKTWSSNQFRGWTLFTFSAIWCAPCNQANSEMGSLVEYLAGYGDVLTVVDILLENATPGTPAGQRDAEKWAAYYGNLRGVTFHPDGVADSNLYQVFDTFSQTDFPGTPDTFPLVVLVDPRHTIRYVAPGWGDTGDGNTVAGHIAQTIGPSIQTPALTSSNTGLATTVYSDVGQLLTDWLPTSGLSNARQTAAVKQGSAVEHALRARRMSVAGAHLQLLAAKLQVWGVSGAEVSLMQSDASFLAGLGSP